MDIGKICRIGIIALEEAYRRQTELSEEGTIGNKVKRGAGGDYSLKGDIESEKEVIEVMKMEEIPAMIYAEEQGIVELCKNPIYLVTIDGIDGSSGVAKDPNARGGTIVAIYSNLNPRYKEAIFGGITDFSTNRIIYAIKGKGAFLMNCKLGGLSEKLNKFSMKPLNSGIRMHFDDPKYWEEYEEGITTKVDENAKIVRNFFTSKLEKIVEPSGLVSSGAMCVDLITGKVDAVGGISAKGVFEQPAEYLILKELGGIIVDYNGKDIGDNYWLEDRKNHKENPVPSLRASSPELANEIIRYLKNYSD